MTPLSWCPQAARRHRLCRSGRATGRGGAMRHVTLAARRRSKYLRPPPHPPWVRTVVCVGAGLGLGIAFWSTSWIMDGGVRRLGWQPSTARGLVGASRTGGARRVRGRAPADAGEALRTQLGMRGHAVARSRHRRPRSGWSSSPGSSRRASRACCPMPCTSACSSVSRSRCGSTMGVSTWSTAPAR